MAVSTPATPTAANPGGAWYDPLANLAIKGLESYTRIAEAKASAKPNNVTVLRAEELNPATGRLDGVTPTGSAGVKVSAMPGWVLPVSIGAGVLGLVLLVMNLGNRK